MNWRYRLATWLLGYAPLRDPDTDGDLHSWLLLRATPSTHTWMRIADLNLERRVDFDSFVQWTPDDPVYHGSVPTGEFSGTLG